MISKSEYSELAAQGYNRIPLVQELLADLDTPLSLYLKLANQPFSYLLESVVGGGAFWALFVYWFAVRYLFEGVGQNDGGLPKSCVM